MNNSAYNTGTIQNSIFNKSNQTNILTNRTELGLIVSFVMSVMIDVTSVFCNTITTQQLLCSRR